jgi:hypothetical protein
MIKSNQVSHSFVQLLALFGAAAGSAVADEKMAAKAP